MVRPIAQALVSIAVAVMSASCTQHDGARDASPDEEAALGYELRVPSDPRAEFVVLGKGGTPERPTIITRRTGSAGTTYSEREYDCAARKVRYLRSQESFAAMKASAPYHDPWGDIVEGSIADVVRREVCK
jgi:hypothetical protein